MIAYRYHPGVHEPVVETVPVPTPGAGEVLVKILAAGVCGSDHSLFEGKWPYKQVFTAGHEGAGVINSLGPLVDDAYPELRPGTYVAVLGTNACMQATCTSCSSGRDNICREPWIGIGADGMWAPYLVVPATSVVVVPGDPASISPAVAAVSTDAVLTPYHAIRSSVRPGQTVLILGCGGLGHNAIQIAKNCTGASCVVACDVRESSLEAALELGVDLTATPDQLPVLIQEHNLSIDVVVDIVGTNVSLQTAVSAVAKGGTIVLVGLGANTVALPSVPSAQKELTVKSTLWGRKSELKEVLQAVKEGLIRPHVETRPLHECGAVLEEMAAGKLQTRVALIP
ncbi:alcohol dehydogenase [Neolentinus lepideus HHB14362 ss-1]|uniref:Alcohol dehydogenase n=1 Tax=Neolentinus lepideus HHB14362 ss-1 TaxID=1314782 RepID=A0A165PKL3_9AGAM|nr:alcohol dehydogenase [Neolentinus lepideus HHB14362 ss-1]